MGLSLGFSLIQKQELRQRQAQEMVQMLKLDLRPELKQVLKMVLKLLQQLLQTNKLDHSLLKKLNTRVFEQCKEQDVKSVAHEVVREVGLKQAATLGNAISFVNELDNYPYRSLEELSHTLNATLKEQMEENWDSDGLALAAQEGQNQAMRLVLKEPSLGIPGTHANLAMVLNLVKQSDEYSKETGILNWVLGGGLAVELQTNQYTRDHKDIDMLCLASEPSFLDTDKVRAGDYFGVISSDSEYISEHCVDCVDWEYGGVNYQVYVLKPEYLFLSKIMKPPRQVDALDIAQLVEKFSKDWDLVLIRELIEDNCCGFDREDELMEILRKRDPAAILSSLNKFWSKDGGDQSNEELVGRTLSNLSPGT